LPAGSGPSTNTRSVRDGTFDADEVTAADRDGGAAVAFLASDDSSFITASSFLVDGGISGAYGTPL
jgi:hypothetical protein